MTLNLILSILLVVMVVLILLGRLLAPPAGRLLDWLDRRDKEQRAADMERLHKQQAQEARAAARLHDELATRFRRL